MGEVELAALLCGFLAGGVAETNHYFDVNGERRRVEVDCETPTHVIEIGLDEKPGSRDSLHQAMFAAYLTDYTKLPAVILIDRDGDEGKFELEMRRVAGAFDVAYGRCTEHFITRWAFTQRMVGFSKTEDFLPASVTARSICDLTAFAVPQVTGVVGVSAPLDDTAE